MRQTSAGRHMAYGSETDLLLRIALRSGILRTEENVSQSINRYSRGKWKAIALLGIYLGENINRAICIIRS